MMAITLADYIQIGILLAMAIGGGFAYYKWKKKQAKDKISEAENSMEKKKDLYSDYDQRIKTVEHTADDIEKKVDKQETQFAELYNISHKNNANILVLNTKMDNVETNTKNTNNLLGELIKLTRSTNGSSK